MQYAIQYGDCFYETTERRVHQYTHTSTSCVHVRLFTFDPSAWRIIEWGWQGSRYRSALRLSDKTIRRNNNYYGHYVTTLLIDRHIDVLLRLWWCNNCTVTIIIIIIIWKRNRSTGRIVALVSGANAHALYAIARLSIIIILLLSRKYIRGVCRRKTFDGKTVVTHPWSRVLLFVWAATTGSSERYPVWTETVSQYNDSKAASGRNIIDRCGIVWTIRY